MNEELVLVSNIQVDSEKKWESLCELLNSLGKNKKDLLHNSRVFGKNRKDLPNKEVFF